MLKSNFSGIINERFKEDENWKDLKVIFSGSDHPGEGEHKIISFIRDYKKTPQFNPKDTHCIYGADADLIMLGLSLHLQNICILREEFGFKKKVCVKILNEGSRCRKKRLLKA